MCVKEGGRYVGEQKVSGIGGNLGFAQSLGRQMEDCGCDGEPNLELELACGDVMAKAGQRECRVDTVKMHSLAV